MNQRPSSQTKIPVTGGTERRRIPTDRNTNEEWGWTRGTQKKRKAKWRWEGVGVKDPFLPQIQERRNICPLGKRRTSIDPLVIIFLLMLHCYCTAAPKQRVWSLCKLAKLLLAFSLASLQTFFLICLPVCLLIWLKMYIYLYQATKITWLSSWMHKHNFAQTWISQYITSPTEGWRPLGALAISMTSVFLSK